MERLGPLARGIPSAKLESGASAVPERRRRALNQCRNFSRRCDGSAGRCRTPMS